MSIQKRFKKQPDVVSIDGQRYFNLREAAKYMSAHLNFVRKLIQKDKLKYIRMGHTFVVDKIDIDHYMSQSKAA
jgi:excisionase family DNA binding protein